VAAGICECCQKLSTKEVLPLDSALALLGKEASFSFYFWQDFGQTSSKYNA